MRFTSTADTILQSDDKLSSQPTLWALVPVKVLGESKQRLNATPGLDRPGITLAMLKDVLSAVVNSTRIERIAVVTADAEVAREAFYVGAFLIDEIEPRGLNAAIKLGVEQIHRLGGGRVVILPADVPLVTGEELDRLMQKLEVEQSAGGNSVVGITPSADGRGTNLLCVDASGEFETRYGPGSYSLHLEEALHSRCRSLTLESCELTLDVDNRADLHTFIRTCLAERRYQASATWKFLQAAGLLETLRKAKGE